MPENLYFLKSFKDYIHSQLSQKNKLQFLVFLCNKPVPKAIVSWEGRPNHAGCWRKGRFKGIPLGGEVAAEMVRNYKRQVYKC